MRSELAPGVQALACLGGGFEYPRFGSRTPDVGQRGVAVVTARLGQIEFADEIGTRARRPGPGLSWRRFRISALWEPHDGCWPARCRGRNRTPRPDRVC